MKKIMKKGAMGIALISSISFALAGCGTQSQPTKTATENTQKTAFNQYITVEPGSKLGPDGKMHDAFIGGDITITQGKPVVLHFLNYDDGDHTYTSSELGLNVTVKGTKTKGKPQETIYTFTPSKTGSFNWVCADPCDGENKQWAMTQKGYMQGTITVLPSANSVQHVSMVINPGYKLGSDGKMHDAFTPGDITVKSGQPVELTVYNFDDGTHTLTSNELGVNLQITGSAKKGQPGISTVTFTPTKDGSFKWVCLNPCDGENSQWAMTQDNFMNGHINVVE